VIRKIHRCRYLLSDEAIQRPIACATPPWRDARAVTDVDDLVRRYDRVRSPPA
jgi:hypothetical protein